MNVCVTCGNELKGRADKRFCDNTCKNQFHNHHPKPSIGRAAFNRINQKLQRNYSILSSIMSTSQRFIAQGDLSRLGFDFSYHTQSEETSDGPPCYFCYDVGYIPVESGYFALISLDEKYSGRDW
ncbi:MAG: hypothetical protein KDC76_08130 [Bacteroidetes bacterium]|nr:hypothetical protein [Bacteroidota bacterium]